RPRRRVRAALPAARRRLVEARGQEAEIEARRGLGRGAQLEREEDQAQEGPLLDAEEGGIGGGHAGAAAGRVLGVRDGLVDAGDVDAAAAAGCRQRHRNANAQCAHITTVSLRVRPEKRTAKTPNRFLQRASLESIADSEKPVNGGPVTGNW